MTAQRRPRTWSKPVLPLLPPEPITVRVAPWTVADPPDQTVNLPNRQRWMAGALCAQVGDPDMWFLDNRHVFDTGYAPMDVCRACPVRVECAQYADDLATVDDVVGTWGGTYHATNRTTSRRTSKKRTRKTL